MKPELLIIIAILLALALVVCGGCNEAQQVPQQVWGQGELPADYQTLFGNSNIARLVYVQTQRVNKQIQDVNELASRVRFLETENPTELAERVRKLESKTTHRHAHETTDEDMVEPL